MLQCWMKVTVNLEAMMNSSIFFSSPYKNPNYDFFFSKVVTMAFFLIPFFLFYFYLYFIMISNIYINFIVHCTCNTVTLITINNFQNIALYSTKYKEKVKYSSKLQTCWLMSNNKDHNFGCWFCCWLSGLTGK